MTSPVPPAAPDNRGEPFGPALASLGGSFAATAKSPLLVESAADVYRFLIGQFNAMDTGDFARLVDGDRTNPVDVLRGVREALRLYAIIPLRKDATTIPSTVPPAPEEGVVVLWRYVDCDVAEIGAYRYVEGPHIEGDEEYRALPADAYDAMEAKASAYPDAMDMIRSLARQLAEAEARLAAAEKARDEAVAFLDMLFTSHWDGTIGRPPTWHLRGDFRHVLSGMRGKTLAEAIAALKRDGEG